MEAEETSASLSAEQEEDFSGENSKSSNNNTAPQTGEVENGSASVKESSHESLDDPDADQSRQSGSSCCSSPPSHLFAGNSPNRPQEMQPRNIVPPLSPNPSDELGSPGPQTGSAGNNSFVLTQSLSMPQYSQFGMQGQIQPQMMQMLQIQQGAPGMMIPPQLTPNGTPVDAYADDRFLKRRKRCGECGPCKVNKNCDQCKNCLNRKVLKQTCIYRKCVYLRKKEQGGDGELVDYPSPVPPSVSDTTPQQSGGFMARSGGQVSPTNVSSTSTQPGSQPLQSQQLQQPMPQPLQQSQPPSQQMLQMQQPSVNGQPPSGFMGHAPGFPVQYNAVMNNGGFVTGGQLMSHPNQQSQPLQQQSQPNQAPPTTNFIPSQPGMPPQQRPFSSQPPQQSVIATQQQQQQTQSAQMSMPPMSAGPTGLTNSQTQIQQQQPQSSPMLPYKNARQSIPDGVDLAKMPPKSFGNGQPGAVTGNNDSLTSILQSPNQQGRITTTPSATLTPTTPTSLHRGVGLYPLPSVNGSGGDMNGHNQYHHAQQQSHHPPSHHLPHHHSHHPHHYHPYLDSQHDYSSSSYPSGSDNPFCHLKMCGGSGHDQKFLSLIPYNDCYMDPQQAYSHYYHQIPQNNFGNANNSSNIQVMQMPLQNQHPTQHDGIMGAYQHNYPTGFPVSNGLVPPHTMAGHHHANHLNHLQAAPNGAGTGPAYATNSVA